MAMLEYLPVERIWNLSIFIKVFVKSGSYSLVLEISFSQEISIFYLQSIFLYAACLRVLILWYFIV